MTSMAARMIRVVINQGFACLVSRFGSPRKALHCALYRDVRMQGIIERTASGATAVLSKLRTPLGASAVDGAQGALADLSGGPPL